MTEKDYNMTGILGRNERREKDTHPTHSGQCTIDGKQFWISAWVNEGNKGKYFKLNFKAKAVSEHRGGTKNPPAQKAAEPQSDFDSNIPF
jgi:hypothetical protein